VSQERAFGLYLAIGGVGMIVIGGLALAAVMRAPGRQSFRARRGLYGSRTMLAVGLVLIMVGLVAVLNG